MTEAGTALRKDGGAPRASDAWRAGGPRRPRGAAARARGARDKRRRRREALSSLLLDFVSNMPVLEDLGDKKGTNSH